MHQAPESSNIHNNQAPLSGLPAPRLMAREWRDDARNLPLSARFGLTTPSHWRPWRAGLGGALANACARAGALGLVGGGYGDLAWTQRECPPAGSGAADTGRIGCGFITWKLDEDARRWTGCSTSPAQRPCAVMLSFGDARRHAARIAASGAP